ncbi:eukaryotic translation initiation factor 3 subunit G domain-containing protein [Ditylenchus destructor]|uniref:Eukaryotic translation initiation factor 3 subunit G n=1 Tax=Ditylenchus destructor TaxID=166010 RepID=A0AAD4NKI3_9BILA|nr:eukaryotic translation initiation factor 3 subunit G domain-containing protein [Ditylenchus destructor]
MTTPLGNLSNVTSIGNWADAVDQESKLNAAAQKRTEITKNGIKTVIDIVDDKDSGKCRVVTTYKVITKKVPRAVAERKKWKKFGAAGSDGPGPQVNTTYVADEVHMQFIKNRAGEAQEQEPEERKSDANKGYGAAKGSHCRICKADDHWSVNCPYKEMYQVTEEEPIGADKSGLKQMGGPTSAPGRYVNPFARGDIRISNVPERRSDDFTCRVTNLPEDSETLEDDLRQMFGSVGRIERFYLAKDKVTNKPKGFAFITFSNRHDAEMAIERFNGAKMEHLILKVEWTKPSNN